MKSLQQYLREIFQLIGKDTRKIPALILLFLGSALLDLAGLGLVGPFIAVIVDPLMLDKTLGDYIETIGLPREQRSMLILLGLMLFGIFLLKAITAIGINYTIIRFSEQQQVRLRSFLMQAYQSLPYAEYLCRNSSEYIHSIVKLTEFFAIGVVFSIMKMISDGILALAILSLLAWSNALVLLLLIGLLGMMIFGYERLFRRKIRGYGIKANRAVTMMIQGVHEGIEGLKEMRILGKEAHFHRVFLRRAEEYASFQTRIQVIADAPRYLLELLMVGFVVLLVVGTTLLNQNLQTLIPTLGVFSVAALRLVPIANTLFNGLIQLRFHRDTVSILHRDISLLKRIKFVDSASRFKNNGVFRIIKLDQVSYAYPNASHRALSDISLVIHAGESIGLMGPSGSGKTTLVDVLLGLLEPQEGQIKYNGNQLKEALFGWRSKVAYIPQQVFLIDNSLRNNVAIGIEDEQIDNERLFEALKQARLIKLVEQLPKGVETFLGEHGVRLSGGQRQRVALARAFYHGRSVLVMDEATSALDNETEKEIIEEIKQLKGQKTMIVIAHRLTTLQHCDRIYELKDGQIINSGSYSELVDRSIQLDNSSISS